MSRATNTSVTDKSLMTSYSLFISDSYCFLAEKLFLPRPHHPKSSESSFRFCREGFFLSQVCGCYMTTHKMLPGQTAISSSQVSAPPVLPPANQAQGTIEQSHFRIYREETSARPGRSRWDFDKSQGTSFSESLVALDSAFSVLALPAPKRYGLEKMPRSGRFWEKQAGRGAFWEQFRTEAREIIWLFLSAKQGEPCSCPANGESQQLCVKGLSQAQIQWDFGSKAGSQGLSFLLALLNLLQYNKFHTLIQVNSDQPVTAVLDFSYTSSSSKLRRYFYVKYSQKNQYYPSWRFLTLVFSSPFISVSG